MNTFAVRLKLISPMQIGAGSLGMIEKTRLYIPPRVIWGAFTNTLTQFIFGNPADDDYVKVGNAVESGKISSFFPEIDGKRIVPVIPEQKWISEDGTRSFPEGLVNSMFLSSVTSTAIDPHWMSAKNATLHATDLIQPVLASNDPGKRTPVFFSGFMELPDSICETTIDQKLVSDIFREARIGGGRKRGWGRVLPDVSECREIYQGYDSIQFGSGTVLTADQPFGDDTKVTGRISLISRREYDPGAGSGQRFSSAALFWETGSVIYAV